MAMARVSVHCAVHEMPCLRTPLLAGQGHKQQQLHSEEDKSVRS